LDICSNNPLADRSFHTKEEKTTRQLLDTTPSDTISLDHDLPPPCNFLGLLERFVHPHFCWGPSLHHPRIVLTADFLTRTTRPPAPRIPRPGPELETMSIFLHFFSFATRLDTNHWQAEPARTPYSRGLCTRYPYMYTHHQYRPIEGFVTASSTILFPKPVIQQVPHCVLGWFVALNSFTRTSSRIVYLRSKALHALRRRFPVQVGTVNNWAALSQ
jgi:hypothetical protein